MTSTAPYHHGDLPNALRLAAVDVIAECGLGAFSLREVARRAGVSHTAPAHHFGDVRGLLTSVAGQGFVELAAAMTTAADAGTGDSGRPHEPVERLTAIGAAYVAFARSHPAYDKVMFRSDLVDHGDASLLDSVRACTDVLTGTLADVIDAERLTVDLGAATWFCWSALQGLVALTPKLEMFAGHGGHHDLTDDDLVRRFIALVVAGLREQ